ncbi:Putative ribonuclease H protein At1g65750 [Linum perenne]
MSNQISIDDVVADYVTVDGNWDLDRLQLLLQNDMISEIAAMLPPRPDRGEDSWVWGLESNGKFSIRSAYELICKPENIWPEVDWKLIWKWKGPSSIQQFLWLVSHERLLTNCERNRRQLTTNSNCPRCRAEEETILHVLRDCNFAKQVWEELGFHSDDPLITEQSTPSWSRTIFKHPRSLLVGICCWYVWKSRNELIFTGKMESTSALVAKINSWNAGVESALSLSNRLISKSFEKVRSDITWEPGPPGWVVLNTDGSVRPASGGAAAGGLLRNEFGFCFKAFSLNLGKCSITRAELRGAIAGLDIAWEAGYRKVWACVDSKVVLDLLNSEGAPTHQHAAEIWELRKALDRNWDVSLSHTYREGNKAADFLADLGHSKALGLHDIDSSDIRLGFLLRHDCMGISEPRIVPR